MMSILLSILIPAPAQGGIDTTTPPPPPSPLKFADSCRDWAPPPPQGLIYQAKRHRSHPNTYFALKQRKLQLENSSFRDKTVPTASPKEFPINLKNLRGTKTICRSVAIFPLWMCHSFLTPQMIEGSKQLCQICPPNWYTRLPA